MQAPPAPSAAGGSFVIVVGYTLPLARICGFFQTAMFNIEWEAKIISGNDVAHLIESDPG
jgi:hypothetical protein